MFNSENSNYVYSYVVACGGTVMYRRLKRRFYVFLVVCNRSQSWQKVEYGTNGKQGFILVMNLQ
jgi:hypothetical protein